MICKASSGSVTLSNNKTMIALLSTSVSGSVPARRPKIKQITIGCPDTPDDQAAAFAIRAITADGTGTPESAFPPIRPMGSRLSW